MMTCRIFQWFFDGLFVLNTSVINLLSCHVLFKNVLHSSLYKSGVANIKFYVFNMLIWYSFIQWTSSRRNKLLVDHLMYVTYISTYYCTLFLVTDIFEVLLISTKVNEISVTVYGSDNWKKRRRFFKLHNRSI